jgi:hypothetical protein
MRESFSERQGRGPRSRPLSLDELKRLVGNVWEELSRGDYMQEAFGYDCVDAGIVEGYLGADPGAHFLRALHRENVWPWQEHIGSWDEDTLLDMVEAMHDLVAQPVDGFHHTFSNCGFHASSFNRPAGRARYRAEMNEVLGRWQTPYEVNDDGELVLAAPAEFAPLLAAQLPSSADPGSVKEKVENAVARFRARGTSMEERRVAVRDLADVLEALRSVAKGHMTRKDESELFNIANNFHIRHNNDAQLRDYDVIWLTWIFYGGCQLTLQHQRGFGGCDAGQTTASGRG